MAFPRGFGGGGRIWIWHTWKLRILSGLDEYDI